MPKLKKRTTIYLNDDLSKQLKMFAIEHNVSVSKLIEDIMDYYVNDIVQYSGDYPEGGYTD